MVLFSCQRLLKVEYVNNSTGVVLLASGRHCHEVDEEHAAAGKKYRWDPRQHAIVEPLVRSRNTATVILRELKRQEAVNSHGIYPTLTQVGIIILPGGWIGKNSNLCFCSGSHKEEIHLAAPCDGGDGHVGHCGLAQLHSSEVVHANLLHCNCEQAICCVADVLT